MVALAYIQAPIPKTLYFSIPAYAVICWVYLRCVAFCPACGKEVYRLSGLTKGRFSCRCGTEFSKAPQGVTRVMWDLTTHSSGPPQAAATDFNR